MPQIGTLYIVATPIGNLEDISYRAVKVLRDVHCIAAEDTRHTQRLLRHYQIQTPLISLHEFNEKSEVARILARLQQGADMALVTDAGTPLISDPGYIVVSQLRAEGISIVPIPGPCAFVTALSAAGLPCARFVFEGFLSSKVGERRSRLTFLQMETRTLVFYEAPHRILKFVEELETIFGAERSMVLAKELTKIFETFFCGTVKEAKQWLQADSCHQQGEFVVIVGGAESTPAKEISEESKRILSILADELPSSQAAALTAKITGEKKNTLYRLCTQDIS